MSTYTPRPVELSDVVLPADLEPLIEQMAKNVHDVWAENRINDGWRYGPERNDERKEHPCLVEYDELPDSEREYDRNTAIGTLKLILKLGFKIEK